MRLWPDRVRKLHAAAAAAPFAVFCFLPVLAASPALGIQPGDPAPGFRALDLAGNATLDSRDLFAGRPWTLLVVWNTECPECTRDFVHVTRRLSAPEWREVSLVTICTDDERVPDARRLVETAHVPGAALWDPDRSVADAYAARSESFAAFLIDARSRIRFAQYGHPDSVDRFLGTLRETMQSATVDGPVAPTGEPPALPEEPEPRSETPEGSRQPQPLLDRIHVRGDAHIRWFQVDVDGRSPTGLYGEELEPQTTLLRRARIEVIGRVSPRVSAGALVRLSNEPDEVLELGPEYYARGEGSAFLSVRTHPATIRLGYYAAHLTPLSFQRWDEADLGLGGTQRGCAVCGGASAGMVLESLEEVGPDITVEGARADGALPGAIDWTVLYARPRERRLEELPGLGIPDETSFRRHQDFYAVHVAWSHLGDAEAPPARIGITALHVRDDPMAPPCPSPFDDPLCAGARYAAARTTAFGADARYAFGGRASVEGEWLRAASTADARGDSIPTEWASGFRLTAATALVPDRLRIEAAFLRLEDSFVSPYGALTYIGNRQGFRFRARGEAGPLAFDLFARRVKPIQDEIAAASAELEWETILSGSASVAFAGAWQAGAGYQREITEVSPHPLTGDGTRNIVQVDAGGEVEGLELSFSHQWIDEDAVHDGVPDAHATVTSVSASARF